MRKAVDIYHQIFSGTNDPFRVFLPAEFTAAAEDPASAEYAGPAGADYVCLFAPPIYYSLSAGIADNRHINDTLLRGSARGGGHAIGVVEPKYGEAAKDEVRRIAGLGAVGVAWSPRAQGIYGNDSCMTELCTLAAECGMISLIHSSTDSTNESLGRIWALADTCPQVPLVVLDALGSWEIMHFIGANRGGPANLRYALPGLTEDRDLKGLVGKIGAERLVYGSGGARHVAPMLDIVARCDIPEAARDAILFHNAAALLGPKLRTVA